MLRPRFLWSAVLAISAALPVWGRVLDSREPDMCLVPPGAQPSLPAKLLSGQGKTDMAVTTKSDEARAFFNQGVSQLHSFWAIEAERSFLQAATLDPNMAMAYWGISVAAAGDHRPSFQLLRRASEGGQSANGATDATQIARTTSGAALDGKIRAREAIQKAMSLRDKVSPRERAYIEAQWARRNPATKDPDAEFVAALRRLVAGYPADLEAKSFLALALLYGYEQPSKAPRSGTLEGVRLLEEIVAADDDHFGAHHYLIHAYEGSRTPEKAWHACERYPQLVTNIPHALHMPGHIYAQSDRLDDAVVAFTLAGANELMYLNADVLYPNGHHGHNIHFLIHSLNLEGRYADSMLQVQHLLSFKESPRERKSDNRRSTWRQGHFGLVKTLVRFERWSEILDARTLPHYDRPEQNAWIAWAVGLAHSATGGAAQVGAALEMMRESVTQSKGTLEPLNIALLELQATLEARAGARAQSWKKFRKAADREAALIYTEPPAYPRPVVEGWGHVALAIGDFEAADRAYAEALDREPGSGRAYIGRAKSLAGLGRTAESDDMRRRARKAWNNADVMLSELVTERPVSAASR